MKLANKCIEYKRRVWVTPDVRYETVGEGRAVHEKCRVLREAKRAKSCAPAQEVVK